MNKKLLVLDLDETLLYASLEPQECQCMVGKYFVQFRPHLVDFLEHVSLEYDLAIWSSASDDYVEQLTREICNISRVSFLFSWGESRCSYSCKFSRIPIRHKKDIYKIAKKYHFPIEQILIVDDSPEKVDRNYGNAIYIDAYYGGENDTSLLMLKDYLFLIKECENFRKIEKRNWRTEVKG